MLLTGREHCRGAGKLTNARCFAANFRFSLDLRRNLIASRGTLIPVTLGDGAPGQEWPLRNRAAAHSPTQQQTVSGANSSGAQ
jgi:hypothetical protein